MKSLTHVFGNGSRFEAQFTAVYRPSPGEHGTSSIGTVEVELNSYPSKERCTITATIDGQEARWVRYGRHPTIGPVHLFDCRGQEYGVPCAKLDPLLREEEMEVRASLSSEWQTADAVLSQALPDDADERELYTAGPKQAAAWKQRKRYEAALEARRVALTAFLASDCPEARMCKAEFASWKAAAERATWNS